MFTCFSLLFLFIRSLNEKQNTAILIWVIDVSFQSNYWINFPFSIDVFLTQPELNLYKG